MLNGRWISTGKPNLRLHNKSIGTWLSVIGNENEIYMYKVQITKKYKSYSSFPITQKKLKIGWSLSIEHKNILVNHAIELKQHMFFHYQFGLFGNTNKVCILEILDLCFMCLYVTSTCKIKFMELTCSNLLVFYFSSLFQLKRMPITLLLLAQYLKKIKAGRPHPRNYSYTPPDYKHTDKHLRLVMTLIALV